MTRSDLNYSVSKKQTGASAAGVHVYVTVSHQVACVRVQPTDAGVVPLLDGRKRRCGRDRARRPRAIRLVAAAAGSDVTLLGGAVGAEWRVVTQWSRGWR